jgi:ATP-dependent DNA helicase RecQ
VITGNYFGDAAIQPCGICDNCLQLKQTGISKETFILVKDRIEKALSNGPISTAALLLQLKDIQKEKAWEVIEFLQSEKKIMVNGDGLIAIFP